MNMRIKIKNYGDIIIKLSPEAAPIACSKVENIAMLNRYDGRCVERLEPGFVFQPLFYDGSDPIMDEAIELEAKSVPQNGSIPFRRGTVAMAGTENSASAAQYFITLMPKDRLNGNFTVIGEVVDGWDVLEKIEAVPVLEGRLGGEDAVFHYPEEDMIIERVIIER